MTLPRTSRARVPLGFTTIDLMVLLCIAATMLALLLPATNRLRQNARLVTCINHLKEMGVILSIYARDHGDFPCYEYVGAPPLSERFDIWKKHPMGCSGISTWQLMLPRLAELGYGDATRFGYCPLALESDEYRWGADFEYGPGPNRGNYLYLGPGTYGAYWISRVMSPRLVDRDHGEYRWHAGTQRHPREWAGVHADGTVRMPVPPNGPQKWSGRRVPLMGEASLESPDKKLRAAPHMSRFKDPENQKEFGGNMNFLFNDGSVATYPFSL